MATSRDEGLLRQALAAGAARDYGRAAELLSALIAGGGAPLEALLYLGRSRHALGELGPAIESFRAYLRAGGDEGRGRFFLGRAFLAGGLHGEALKALRKSVEADPTKAGSWALLGAAELKLRRSGPATAHLEKAVGLAPHDARIYRGYLNALFVRGVRDLHRGESDLAAQTFAFVIANGFDSTAARLWRARALRQEGRHAEALAECEAAAAQAPGDPGLTWLRAGILLDLGRRKEALALASALGGFEAEGAGRTQDSASLALLRAGAAFRRGAWKEAATASLAALREGGELPARTRAGLHAMAAESLRRTGNPGRAIEEAARAVEADPREPELRLGLALALFDLERHKEALAELEGAKALGAEGEDCEYLEALCKSRLGLDNSRVLSLLQDRLRRDARAGLAPDHRLLFGLGECLYRESRPELALGWFDKVLELVPGHELALLYRVSIAESSGDGSLRREASRTYLERYPDNATIRREYAEFLAAEEEWEEISALLEAGLPWAGASSSYRRLLGRALRETGRWRDGALLYRDLLIDEPADGELLMALCLCLHNDGRSALAWALLDKAPPEALRRAGPWVVKGLLAERLEKSEEALDAFRRATEIEPGIERPWRELARIYEAKGLYASAQEARERAAKALPKGEIPLPRRPGASKTTAPRGSRSRKTPS